MSDLLLKTKAGITEAIKNSIEAAMKSGKLPEGEIPEIKLEIPADRKKNRCIP